MSIFNDDEFKIKEKELFASIKMAKNKHIYLMPPSGINLMFKLTINDKKYLFKCNGTHNTYSDFGEVITSFVFKKLGLNSINAHFCFNVAENKTEDFGTLMDNYQNPKNEYLSLTEIIQNFGYNCFTFLPLNQSLDLIKKFAEKYELVIDKNVETDLKALAVLDYLLLQEDRHTGNIGFEIFENKYNKKVLKLVPFYDNERCLFLEAPIKHIKVILEKDFKSTQIFKFAKKDENLRVMAREILKSKKLQKIIKEFYQLDFNKIISLANELSYNVSKRTLPPDYQKAILFGVERRKNELMEELNRQNLKNIIDSESVV